MENKEKIYAFVLTDAGYGTPGFLSQLTCQRPLHSGTKLLPTSELGAFKFWKEHMPEVGISGPVRLRDVGQKLRGKTYVVRRILSSG